MNRATLTEELLRTSIRTSLVRCQPDLVDCRINGRASLTDAWKL